MKKILNHYVTTLLLLVATLIQSTSTYASKRELAALAAAKALKNAAQAHTPVASETLTTLVQNPTFLSQEQRAQASDELQSMLRSTPAPSIPATTTADQEALLRQVLDALVASSDHLLCTTSTSMPVTSTTPPTSGSSSSPTISTTTTSAALAAAKTNPSTDVLAALSANTPTSTPTSNSPAPTVVSAPAPTAIPAAHDTSPAPAIVVAETVPAHPYTSPAPTEAHPAAEAETAPEADIPPPPANIPTLVIAASATPSRANTSALLAQLQAIQLKKPQQQIQAPAPQASLTQQQRLQADLATAVVGFAARYTSPLTPAQSKASTPPAVHSPNAEGFDGEGQDDEQLVQVSQAEVQQISEIYLDMCTICQNALLPTFTREETTVAWLESQPEAAPIVHINEKPTEQATFIAVKNFDGLIYVGMQNKIQDKINTKWFAKAKNATSNVEPDFNLLADGTNQSRLNQLVIFHTTPRPQKPEESTVTAPTTVAVATSPLVATPAPSLPVISSTSAETTRTGAKPMKQREKEQPSPFDTILSLRSVHQEDDLDADQNRPIEEDEEDRRDTTPAHATPAPQPVTPAPVVIKAAELTPQEKIEAALSKHSGTSPITAAGIKTALGKICGSSGLDETLTKLSDQEVENLKTDPEILMRALKAVEQQSSLTIAEIADGLNRGAWGTTTRAIGAAWKRLPAVASAPAPKPDAPKPAEPAPAPKAAVSKPAKPLVKPAAARPLPPPLSPPLRAAAPSNMSVAANRGAIAAQLNLGGDKKAPAAKPAPTDPKPAEPEPVDDGSGNVPPPPPPPTPELPVAPMLPPLPVPATSTEARSALLSSITNFKGGLKHVNTVVKGKSAAKPAPTGHAAKKPAAAADSHVVKTPTPAPQGTGTGKMPTGQAKPTVKQGGALQVDFLAELRARQQR